MARLSCRFRRVLYQTWTDPESPYHDQYYTECGYFMADSIVFFRISRNFAQEENAHFGIDSPGIPANHIPTISLSHRICRFSRSCRSMRKK